MGLFSKKIDPIESQAKALEKQIAALEKEIRQLDRRATAPSPIATSAPAQATPHSGGPVAQAPRSSAPVPAHPSAHTHAPGSPRQHAREPIFESVEHAAPRAPGVDDKAHFNDLGVRKYDLPDAWRRLLNRFRGQSTRNPKLVTYLATGSIRGLQPLRYERRIARNNFLLMTFLFLLALSWLILVLVKHR